MNIAAFIFLIAGFTALLYGGSQDSDAKLWDAMHVVEAAAERVELLLTFGTRERVRAHLTLARERLDEAARINTNDENRIISLMRDYSAHVRALREETERIHSAGEEKLLLSAFRQLAAHHPILRAIQQRLPEHPLDVIDAARAANVGTQEELVERIATASATSTHAAVPANHTEALLSCPDCNVILISLTALRKDHMGLYGYDKPTTPAIDAFFKNSLLFDNAFAPTAWTLPNAISFFTSLFPATHGIVVREFRSTPVLLNKKILTFSQLLSERGYKTAAFTGGGDYSRRLSGLDRGFNLYLDEVTYGDFSIEDELADIGGGSLSYVSLRAFVDHVANWLTHNADDKFFLFVQGYDAHCPYIPREPFASRFTKGLRSDIDFSTCYWTFEDTDPVREETASAESYWPVKTFVRSNGRVREEELSPSDVAYMVGLYDARIAESDHHLGTLFQRIRDLGLERKTIIIFMSEHGEMLGEHGWFMRGGAIRGQSYEPTLNFPLLIKHPNVTKPIVIKDVIQTVDLMPTLLRLLDVPDPQEKLREGRPLAFSALGDPPTNEYVYSSALYVPTVKDRFFNIPTASEVIRGSEWKLVKNTIFKERGLVPDLVSYKLYNIARDPREHTDVYETETAVAEDLQGKLEVWLRRYATP